MFGSHTFKFNSFEPVFLDEEQVDKNLEKVLKSLRSKGISVDCTYSNKNPHFPEEITLEGEMSPYDLRVYFQTGLSVWCPTLSYDNGILFHAKSPEDSAKNNKVTQRMTILRLLTEN